MLQVGRGTVTANIEDIQRLVQNENKDTIDRDNTVEALAKINLLRQTKTIQISLNIKFVQFKKYQIQFTPDYQKSRQNKKSFTNISFLNVPEEAAGEPLTEFLENYADIEGPPFHSEKEHKGIPYYAGTQVYQVSKIHEHFQRYIAKMFGKTVKCIYTRQPENYGTRRYDKIDR